MVKYTKSQEFYRDALKILKKLDVPFLMGGGFAVGHYTGYHRDTKDLDVFCKPEDYIHIIKHFEKKGFKTEIFDSRWLVKIHRSGFYVDLIFNTYNNICTVDEEWFRHCSKGKLYNLNVCFVPPEELYWCKIYVQNRERYDGADLNHLVLRYGKKMNWERVLNYINPHWQLLLSHLINYQFVYPSDRDNVPKWLIDELLRRYKESYQISEPTSKICQGPLIDNTSYKIDITEWDYKAVTLKSI